MSRRRPEGMLMAPRNGGGSGPPSGRKKAPTGDAYPIVGDKSGGNGNGDNGDDEEDGEDQLSEVPMEVVFKAETFRKLIIWTLGPMLITMIGAISAFFYFYHQTNSHMGDPTIHLTRGERGKLETKEEASKERKKLEKDITSHFDVKVREIRVEQREQVEKIGKKLEHDQKIRLNQILTEVKKARQDIRSQ